jgi:hypothetical protein
MVEAPGARRQADSRQREALASGASGECDPVWGKQQRRRHRMLTWQMRDEVNRLAAGGQVDAPAVASLSLPRPK